MGTCPRAPAGAAANSVDGAANRVAGAAAVGSNVSLQRQHIEVKTEWSKFIKLFLMTAAQVGVLH
jgi:hypothetical protein